ncbi:hypothetical protein EON63_06410 [archaeon]|nr:MAG: hypothetical protein EON63_06410 [archaeon]
METHHPHLFKVVYCVGSRYDQVTWGAKKKNEYVPPPVPRDFETLRNKEMVWCMVHGASYMVQAI